ncbi:MAG: metallophosphoesterase [DPANN group archaeon]|nr:metallophosphoesterase [DPANN group archaeon]
MDILPGLRIIDLALYIEKEHILVIADTHIGYEASLQKQGIMVPGQQMQLTLARLENILAHAGTVETIIIDGDIKDDFSEITDSEWRDLKRLFEFLDTKVNNLILIKGNHDTFLPPIAKKFDVPVFEKYEQGNYCFMHGDRALPTKKKVIIIGHEHPALTLRDNGRKETFKCFLKGTYKKQNLIVLPSFNLLMEGQDILRRERLSPLLDDISDFEVFVAGDQPLLFGKVGELKRRMG